MKNTARVSKLKCLCCFILALAISTTATAVSARTWTDSSGNFQVEAELVSVDDDRVTLRKEDGQVIAVPLKRLSAADRKFLADREKPAIGDEDGPDEKRPRPMGGDAKAVDPDTMLTQRVQAEFVDTPLRDVIDFLANQTQGPILFDQPEMDAIGIAADAPVTANDEGTLHDVLSRILKAKGLSHIVRHDVVLITSAEAAASKYLQTRAYRLRRRVGFDKLVDGITTTVAPDSWADVGGPASVAPLAVGGLLVRQSWAAHREIEKSFGDMLQPLAAPPVVGSTPLAKALAKSQPVEFLQVPLKDVAELFSEKLGVRVRMDEAALAEEGIPANTPVTMSSVNIPLGSALSLISEQYDLAWARDKGEIVISTPVAMEENMAIARYGFQGLTSRPDARDVTEAIKSTILPSSWDDVGGPASLKAVAPGQVAIRHSDAAHREIEKLLATLQGKR